MPPIATGQTRSLRPGRWRRLVARRVLGIARRFAALLLPLLGVPFASANIVVNFADTQSVAGYSQATMDAAVAAALAAVK